jgi:hypothetical protein
MCSLCNLSKESAEHLFIDCSFARRIWSWLSSIINIPCNFSSMMEIVCKLVTLAAITYCFNLIWFIRNQKRFSNKSVDVRNAINLIISGISMSSNNSSLKAHSSISEFVLFGAFSVKRNFGNAPKVKEVLWHPPIINLIKCNIDGGPLLEILANQPVGECSEMHLQMLLVPLLTI